MLLGLFTAATNSNTGISAGWSTDPIDYYNGVDDGDGDYTIGVGFMFSGINTGDIVNIQYAYIFGPSSYAAASGAVAGGAGGATSSSFTITDVGSASAPTTPSTPTVTGTTTTNTVTTSTSTSATTSTSYVTRTETSTDADGNPVVRTYTDTVVTTTPVDTTTTTTTPVTTTTYSDGTSTTTNWNSCCNLFFSKWFSNFHSHWIHIRFYCGYKTTRSSVFFTIHNSSSCKYHFN